MFREIILPVIGIIIAVTVGCYLVGHPKAPFVEPLKGWLWWAILAIGICWILFGYVLPFFGVRV